MAAQLETGEFRDALETGPARGRGAQLNPANRFEGVRLHVLGEHLDEVARGKEPASRVQTEVLLDRSRSLINRVDHRLSPDIGFDWTINPYRGCEHGCIYCYARPDHERLGFSCGLDFETRIMAKPDAPEILLRELASPKWMPQTIVMSGVTDPYQPIEAKLNITRRCLEVLAQCRQPVSIVTKNRLVLRDLDLLQKLASHDAVRVAVSLTTLDRHLAMKMEPRASSPADRLRTIEMLAASGVPTAVIVAPIIPGLTDHQTPRILHAAGGAGARWAGYVLLRLPYQIKTLFLDWLVRHFPDRAQHVEALVRRTRHGKLYDPSPGARMRGTGPVADQIRDLFKIFAHRYGLDQRPPPLAGGAFRRPLLTGQMELFV